MSSTELGRNESIMLRCEYEGRADQCPKECVKCAIGIKTDGDIALSSGNYVKAVEHYRKAVFLSPKFAEAWNNMGNAYGMGSNYEKALTAFDKAISIDPTYGKALYGKAITLRNLNRFSEAMELGKSILKMYDNDEVRNFVQSITEISTHESDMDQDFKSFAMNILDKNDLLNFDGTYSIIEDIYQEETFTEKVIEFCRDIYSAQGKKKLIGEYIITTYYASLCASIYYVSGDITEDDDTFEWLTNSCNLEYMDLEAERLLNTKAGEERAEHIWDIISPYVGYCSSIFEGTDDDIIFLNGMKYAYIIGMLVGKYEAETDQSNDNNAVENQLSFIADSAPKDEPAPVESAMCYSPRRIDYRDAEDDNIFKEENRKRQFFEALRKKYDRGI